MNGLAEVIATHVTVPLERKFPATKKYSCTFDVSGISLRPKRHRTENPRLVGLQSQRHV
jgi:hypothetical protein